MLFVVSLPSEMELRLVDPLSLLLLPDHCFVSWWVDPSKWMCCGEKDYWIKCIASQVERAQATIIRLRSTYRENRNAGYEAELRLTWCERVCREEYKNQRGNGTKVYALMRYSCSWWLREKQNAGDICVISIYYLSSFVSICPGLNPVFHSIAG